MKIIFASHTCFNENLVVGSHHLSRNLALLGHQVLHLSAPLTPLHALQLQNPHYRHRWNNWLNGGRQILHHLTDYVPMSLVPWQLARRFPIGPRNLFLDCLPGLCTILKRFDFEKPDLLLVDEPRMAGIEAICNPIRLFYRSTDLNADFKKDPSILRAEKWLIDHSEGLIGTSAPVLSSLQSVAPEKPALLLENGVEQDFFATPQPVPAEYANIPEPRAVYVGAIDQRFDFDAIDALAKTLPNFSIILVGPVSEAHSLNAKNVHILGPRPYSLVPAYLQHSQVGLLPLNEHLANRGRSPMKLYEYAAAGLPVVARITGELARRNEPFVTLYAEAALIGEAVQTALGKPESRMLAQAAARSRDWKTLTEKLLSFIN